VIVSMVWQAMTLLRSQHPGLGPGESTNVLFRGHIKPVQVERVNAAGWDGHVFLGRSQICPKPALLDQ